MPLVTLTFNDESITEWQCDVPTCRNLALPVGKLRQEGLNLCPDCKMLMDRIAAVRDKPT
jgi:hypothetical protein